MEYHMRFFVHAARVVCQAEACLSLEAFLAPIFDLRLGFISLRFLLDRNGLCGSQSSDIHDQFTNIVSRLLEFFC